MKIAVTVKEATNLVPTSEDTIYRAIHKDAVDGKFPPPLRAKKDSRGRLSIKVTELDAWHDSWDDA